MLYKIFYLIKYLFLAKGKHSIHATFLFQLYTEIILKKWHFSNFSKIENIRNILINNQELLQFEDLGAGKYKKRKVSEIAKTSLSSPKYAQLQFKLIRHFKPKTILEIGTSLGINSLYFSAAAPDSQIITLEGIQEIAAIAEHNFHSLGATIEVIKGEFDETLPLALKKLNNLDYVFIDGNHTYLATIKYFNEIIKYTHEKSIIVIDDIYWSKEMTKAWSEIISHSSVRLTLDFYKFGVIFLSKNQSYENFILKY